MARKPDNTIGTIVVAFGVTIVLTISVLAMLPALVRADRVKAHLAEQVKAATGHDLTIGGKVTVSLFPSLSVHLADVALRNPPGFAAADLVRAEALDVELELLPLLSGRAKFDRFVLTNPTATLEVDRQGRTNWAFSPLANSPDGALRLGEIQVVDGRITYLDDRVGSRETAQSIDMTLRLASLDAPLSARGTLSWHGRPVTLAVDVARPRVLADGSGASPAEVSLAAGPLRLTFAGRADAAADSLDGDLDLSSPSLDELARWVTGRPPAPPRAALGKLSLTASLATTPGSIALHQAAATLGGARVAGDLTVATGGARPLLTGALTVDGLDLTPWLPAAGPEWNTAPIDASALRGVDLDLGVTVDSVAAGRVRAGPGTLTLRLRDGRLSADLADLALYGGTAQGRLTVDGSGTGLGFDTTMAVEGVRAGPLLAAAGFDRLAGTATAALRLNGRGDSERQVVASLAGEARAALHDGTARGLDLAAGRGTAFADLTGSWTVAAGMVTSRSLVLRSPELQIDGSGTIDLPGRSLAYRLVPRPPATLVPLVVEGRWDDLSCKPDPAALAAAPAPAPAPVTPAPRPAGRGAGGGGGR